MKEEEDEDEVDKEEEEEEEEEILMKWFSGSDCLPMYWYIRSAKTFLRPGNRACERVLCWTHMRRKSGESIYARTTMMYGSQVSATYTAFGRFFLT